MALATGPGGAYDIAVDSSHVYWTTDNAIMKVAIDGGSTIELAKVERPGAIAIDDHDVYWIGDTNFSRDTISKVSIDGGTAITLVPAYERGVPYDIAVDGTHVYWTDLSIGSGGIMKLPLSGGEPEQCVFFQKGIRNLIVNDTHVYWHNPKGHQTSPFIRGARKTDTGPTYDITFDIPTDARAIAVDETYVFWTTKYDGLGFRAHEYVDNFNHQIAYEGFAFSIAVDGTHVYWTDDGTTTQDNGAIARAKIGEWTATVIAEKLPEPHGIALGADHVFWTDSESGAVMKFEK